MMINTVYKILKKVGVPVKYILRPDFKKHDIAISYHFFNESFELYGDGSGIRETGALQVDIFSTRDYSKEVEKVQELLIEKGFKLADKRDIDDVFSKINYYHKIMIFNYDKKEVMKNGI